MLVGIGPLLTGFALVLLPVALGAIAILVRYRSLIRNAAWALLAGNALFLLAGLLAGAVDWLLHAQLLFMTLAYASVRSVAARLGPAIPRIRAGVVAGLVLLAVVSLLQVSGLLGPLRAPWEMWLQDVAVPAEALGGGGPRAVRAGGWASHPNSWGAAALVPLFFSLSLPSRWRGQLAVLAPALVVIVSSGSRAALLGLLVGSITLLALRTQEPDVKVRRAGGWLLLAMAGLLAASLAVPGWRQRILPASAFVSQTTGNLFQSSEVLSDAVWWRPWVEVVPAGGSAPPSEWTLLRTGGDWVSRLQQRIVLAPDTPFVASFEFRGADLPGSPLPGLIGWGTLNGNTHELVVRMEASRDWSSRASGAVELLESKILTLAGGWQRLEVAFRNRGDRELPFELGVAPNTATELSDLPLWIRSVQVESGVVATSYQPTQPPDRTGLEAATAIRTRLEIYSATWPLLLERPLFGWGPAGFEAVTERAATPAVAAAAHEHSLVLWAALRYGAMGLLALGLIIAAFWHGQSRHLPMVAAVLVANLFDLTFWAPGVSYALALAAGVELAVSRPGSTGARI